MRYLAEYICGLEKIIAATKSNFTKLFSELIQCHNWWPNKSLTTPNSLEMSGMG